MTDFLLSFILLAIVLLLGYTVLEIGCRVYFNEQTQCIDEGKWKKIYLSGTDDIWNWQRT